MKHSTPTNKNGIPRERTLNFLKTFARLYDPLLNNENEARMLSLANIRNAN